MSYRIQGDHYLLTNAQVANLWNSEDGRAAAAGRKGGQASGATRRRKAAIKASTLKFVADTAYTQWLADVTEEELREFIRWRGQRKRKATLAAAALNEFSEDEEEEVDRQETITELVKHKSFFASIKSYKHLTFSSVSFNKARQKYSRDYPKINAIFASLAAEFYKISFYYYSQFDYSRSPDEAVLCGGLAEID